MILVQLHQRKEQLPRDSHPRCPSEDHRKQFKTYFQNPNVEPDRACQDIKTSLVGKTEVGKSLEPLAGREELAGISSSEIRVLFMVGIYLGMSYQYVIACIHSFNEYLFIYRIPRIIDAGDTEVKK